MGRIKEADVFGIESALIRRRTLGQVDPVQMSNCPRLPITPPKTNPIPCPFPFKRGRARTNVSVIAEAYREIPLLEMTLRLSSLPLSRWFVRRKLAVK
jgi:hypothetical protein